MKKAGGTHPPAFFVLGFDTDWRGGLFGPRGDQRLAQKLQMMLAEAKSTELNSEISNP